MKVLGIRYCAVSGQAKELAGFFGDGLGLPAQPVDDAGSGEFCGAIFPAGESWIEVWPDAVGMPEGVMLQVVVDDADAWAEQARSNGLDPKGPNDMHGERIYYLNAPGGLAVSFQSKLATS